MGRAREDRCGALGAGQWRGVAFDQSIKPADYSQLLCFPLTAANHGRC
jgi:hypothetical protein